MSTPLVLKACGISLKYYKAILKYSPFFYFNPESNNCTISKSKRERTVLFLYLVSLVGVLACFLDVLYCVFVGRLKVSLKILILNILETLLVFMVTALLSVMVPNLHVIKIQYFNTLINYELSLRRVKRLMLIESPLTYVLKQGNTYDILICNILLYAVLIKYFYIYRVEAVLRKTNKSRIFNVSFKYFSNDHRHIAYTFLIHNKPGSFFPYPNHQMGRSMVGYVRFYQDCLFPLAALVCIGVIQSPHQYTGTGHVVLYLLFAVPAYNQDKKPL